MISEKIMEVRRRIDDACRRVGRNPDEVILIAVSKTRPVGELLEAYQSGILHFGENKVQELVEKIPQMPSDIHWHMIGHLQRNKAKYVVGKTNFIHSVDSLRLAEEISKEAVRQSATVQILIEVNVAQEDSKFGISAEETAEIAEKIAKLPGVWLKGLMTIAPYTENAEDNRLYFRKLKQLSVDIKNKNIDNVSMDVLSMGMTGDYEVAVEEGSTCVRVGTGIFGERQTAG